MEARNQIGVWYDDHDAPSLGDYDEDYGARGVDGTPFIADDSDVTVIAAHLTRLAIDVLQNAVDSAFPYSAYVIGLSQSWIFMQPFETHPIDLKPTGPWVGASAIAATADVRDLLRELTEPLVG